MPATGAQQQPDLDAWLPDPAVRTRHEREVEAPAGETWRLARAVRLQDTRTLGRLVRWRIPGTAQARTYHDLFRGYPFVVLDAGERHVVSGLCGRIWTIARDYPELAGAEDFAEWRGPGTARVLFAHWAAPLGRDRSLLVSEARVAPVDRVAAMRLKALWAVIGRFERLVGAEPLELAARRAEGR